MNKPTSAQQLQASVLLFEAQLLTILQPIYEGLEDGRTSIVGLDNYDMEGDWIYGRAVASDKTKIHFSIDGDLVAFIDGTEILEQVGHALEQQGTTYKTLMVDKVHPTKDSIEMVATVDGEEMPFTMEREGV